ncbi:hypothetical protein RF11_03336 [Thelohanellus kitauei]|uniref:Uncharacterized protein n=1 Tax=Thelohanellus kitauei TaxID=669202 RepID=A0A0C2MT05_THEKT|nr:hypothetical protein RF11_03336 [Thelohanellus kitauei]
MEPDVVHDGKTLSIRSIALLNVSKKLSIYSQKTFSTMRSDVDFFVHYATSVHRTTIRYILRSDVWHSKNRRSAYWRSTFFLIASNHKKRLRWLESPRKDLY